MIYREYYKQLGRLLYAIADVDGKVQRKELEEVKRIVQEELVHLESSTDEYETDLAYATEFEFDVLQDRSLSWEEAFYSFTEFVHTSPELPTRLKTLAYRSALKVAGSFHGTNHQEAELLERLKEALRQPPVRAV